MKKKYSLKGIIVSSFVGIFIGVILLGAAIYNPFFEKVLTDMQSLRSSCEGIEEYYTGGHFKYDVNDLLFDANHCYYPVEQDRYKGWFPPKALKNCTGKEGIDCEDISHMVMCLANLYDIDCDYYITISTYEEGHQGITCMIDGEEWEVY